MGMESYSYVIEFEDNLEHAIDKLQQCVFASGDYRFSENGHNSIDEARNDAAENGTKSALNIYGISPKPHFACITALNTEELMQIFGKPQLHVDDVTMINSNEKFWQSIGRGQARLITLYDDKNQPSQYYIAGYSFA